jgi:hypothetical protein
MAVPDGVYRIGPESGRLLVRTARTGLGAKAGHDLTIEATQRSPSTPPSRRTPR